MAIFPQLLFDCEQFQRGLIVLGTLYLINTELSTSTQNPSPSMVDFIGARSDVKIRMPVSSIVFYLIRAAGVVLTKRINGFWNRGHIPICVKYVKVEIQGKGSRNVETYAVRCEFSVTL